MPNVVEKTVKAYAHCVRPTCPGTLQEQVEAVEVLTEYMFTDNGGDIPGVERSKYEHRFVDAADEECTHCGGRRELTDKPRRLYENLSGHPQDGLLNIPRYNPSLPLMTPGSDPAALDDLRAQVAAQAKQIDRLLDALGEKTTEDGGD